MHTAAPVSTPKGDKLSEGTSLQTVLGRSSALFGTSEEFSAEIARSRKYAYSWSKGCDALAPAVRMGSPLETRPVPRAALFTAMVFWNDDTLLAANIDRSHPELCQLSGRDGWKAWQCAINRTPLADRINKLSRLPDGELAIGEALLPPSMRKAGESADFVAGGVSLGRMALSDGGPVLSVERRVPTPFGSVYALQPVEDGLIVGGENGICMIIAGARTCTSICRRTLCTKDDEWRVNGLLRLDKRTVLAVGRDMTGGRAYPMAKWYRRDDGGWRQLAALGPRAALVSLSSSLLSRRTGMQLKAPVLVHGEAVAFGSDGSSYRLAIGQEPQRLSISRMWKVSSPDANRDEIEDAVRDAVVLRSGYIAVAASDGAVHLLRPGARAPLALEGDQGLTVFDRGIWTTELAQANDTLFVRAQDGNIHFIDLAKLQRSTAVTSR